MRISIKMLECSIFRGCSSHLYGVSQTWVRWCSPSPQCHKPTSLSGEDPGALWRMAAAAVFVVPAGCGGAGVRVGEAFGICRQQHRRPVESFGVLWIGAVLQIDASHVHLWANVRLFCLKTFSFV